MESYKESIYFAVIVRAFKRLGITIGLDNGFDNYLPVLEDVECRYCNIIDEAEFISSGVMSKEVIDNIPLDMMDCMLECIGGNKKSLYEYSSAVLSLNKGCFPKLKHEEISDRSFCIEKIKCDLYKIQKNDILVMSENMLQILFKYAAYIPSNIKNTDVSLYDQTRVAAALAVSLYDIENTSGADQNKQFLLIGADFSGIQSYIYQIVSKYAGKSLKGRSFYLRLLSDSIVDYILKELSLYDANVIYNSGGSFYILAPNTDFIKKTLSDAIKVIERNVFEVHGTLLYVAIDCIAVSKSEISNQHPSDSLSNIWKALFDKRDNKKQSKFALCIESDYNSFFSPQNVDGNKCDIITGEDLYNDDKYEIFNNDKFISEFNSLQISLGKDLKKCECIVSSDTEAKCWNNKVHVQPASLGRYYYLLSIKDILENVDFLEKHIRGISIKLLNGYNGNCDFEFLPELTHCPVFLEFYGGNAFNCSTFEQMCDDSQLNRMGILRMDVDNLGNIFQEGIAKEKATLTRYASLSRSFDHFFSGYINTIVQSKENVEKSFIIYSGGDDLFIVGEWTTVIRIAKTVREDFRSYTCENSIFSISGGIAILKAKYPLIIGSEESAIEEARAKQHVCKNAKKDSISFMNTPLNWSREFPVVEMLKNELLSLVMQNILPKSFLSKIMLYLANADILHHRIRNVKIYWMVSYDLKRFLLRNKNEKARQIVLNCQKEIWENGQSLNGVHISTDYHLLELWAFACRWAELEYRMCNIKK